MGLFSQLLFDDQTVSKSGLTRPGCPNRCNTSVLRTGANLWARLFLTITYRFHSKAGPNVFAQDADEQRTGT